MTKGISKEWIKLKYALQKSNTECLKKMYTYEWKKNILIN